MLVEADFREGNAINGLDKRNRSEQDRVSGVPIATTREVTTANTSYCYGQLFS